MSKRTEIMIAEDKAKISELLVRGHRNKAEIARILNEGRDEQYHISAAQVSKDITAIEEAYLEKSVENIEIYRHRALEELYYLLKKCYEGYEKSCLNKVTLESMKTINDDEEYQELMGGEFEQEELEEVNLFTRNGKLKEEFRGEGNPAFLNSAKSILDSINKIKGVDGASKISLTDPSGTQEYVGIAEMMKARMDELAVRVAPTDTDKFLLAPMPEEELSEDYVDVDEEELDNESA